MPPSPSEVRTITASVAPTEVVHSIPARVDTDKNDRALWDRLRRALLGPTAGDDGAVVGDLESLVSAAEALAQRADDAETQLTQIGGRLEEFLVVVTSLTALEYEEKVALREDDDWIVNALAIGLNIMGDELAQATHELRAARDRALAASRAKSAFLANMSHELRTPLNAIIGYSELIREELADGDISAISGDLRHVEASARHLLNLIQDTLDLSKIEAGKMDLVLSTFEIGALLREVARAIEPILYARGNTLEIAIADDLGPYTGDRTKVRQIFDNLLSNAAKFTDHGEIRIEAELREFAGRPALRAAIQDTGIGIPADKLPLIFGAFNQADLSTSTTYGGTGLGLTISRHFAEMMGGTLLVTSEVGRGSTFIVDLPMTTIPRAPPPLPPGAIDDRRRGHAQDLTKTGGETITSALSERSATSSSRPCPSGHPPVTAPEEEAEELRTPEGRLWELSSPSPTIDPMAPTGLSGHGALVLPAAFSIRFSPSSHLIVVVRRFVQSFYAEVLDSTEVSAEVALVTHELLENAVKYGTTDTADLAVTVDRAADGGITVEVETQNHASPENAAIAAQIVGELTESSDLFAYYQRQIERAAERTHGSGLGLVRIAAETAMTLHTRCDGDRLAIVASAHYPLAPPAAPENPP